MKVLKRCPIASCRELVSISTSAFSGTTDYDNHMYDHYNYCEYGHYEEFDVGDPEWPRCKVGNRSRTEGGQFI